jgi:RNA polymerase sigma-70 factor (ECF subfamily)
MGSVPSDVDLDSTWIVESVIDPQKFARIFERHAPAVHRYLARRVEPSAVDDLLSETFVIAFRTRRSYDMEYDDARPWLFGIATNVIHHHRRSEGRRSAMVGRAVQRKSTELTNPDIADDVVVAAESDRQVALMKSVLSRIDAKYLDVLTLFTGPQLSYDEISRALEIPVGTVRSRLSRARAQLRELLEGAGQYLGDGEQLNPGPNAEEYQQ